MSKVWSIMIVSSLAFAMIVGSSSGIINNITSGASSAVENVFGFVGMLCFWSGIFNILKNTTLIKKFSKIIKPIAERLFNKDEVDDEMLEAIGLNVAANALGAGNAATVYSIDAIEKMQKKNKRRDTLNDSMSIFILLNTASMQIIPTTMISLRAVHNSQNPLAIILPVWIVTLFALVIGLFMIKVLNKV